MKSGESISGIDKLEKAIDQMWLTSIWDPQLYKWQDRSYLFLQLEFSTLQCFNMETSNQKLFLILLIFAKYLDVTFSPMTLNKGFNPPLFAILHNNVCVLTILHVWQLHSGWTLETISPIIAIWLNPHFCSLCLTLDKS